MSTGSPLLCPNHSAKVSPLVEEKEEEKVIKEEDKECKLLVTQLDSPVPHDLIDVSFVMDGNKEATRPAEDEAKLLTGEAHSGGVHNGHVLFNILTQQTVEQPLVTVLSRGMIKGKGAYHYMLLPLFPSGYMK